MGNFHCEDSVIPRLDTFGDWLAALVWVPVMHGVRRRVLFLLSGKPVDKAMSLFDPAATAKSVHDTIDDCDRRRCRPTRSTR
jgi:hypothetical protein